MRSRLQNQSGRGVVADPVRPEADRLQHAADRAGLDQLAGGDGGGLRVVLGIEDREDAAGLGLHAAQLGELVERRRARLVEHHVLAVAHGADRHRRAVGQDAGADDEPDLRIVEDCPLVADAAACG